MRVFLTGAGLVGLSTALGDLPKDGLALKVVNRELGLDEKVLKFFILYVFFKIVPNINKITKTIIAIVVALPPKLLNNPASILLSLKIYSSPVLMSLNGFFHQIYFQLKELSCF